MKTYSRLLIIIVLLIPADQIYGQSNIADDYQQMIEKIKSEFNEIIINMRDAMHNPTANITLSSITLSSRNTETALAAEGATEIELCYDEIPVLWPADDHLIVSSPYGYRTDPFTRQRAFHHGIDIPMPENTPVLSTAAGTVEKTGNDKISGWYIVINHQDHKTIYAHLKQIVVKEGMKVKPGTIIGYSGNTGRSTGPHLHYQICTQKGSTINPINLIKQHQNH